MCISIIEADAICISMRYTEDTHEAACDTIHPYYDAVPFDFDTMQFDAMEKI